MAGKLVLVTGATAGIGLVTARELARAGANVVLVGRSPERCQQAVDLIRKETGNPAVEAIVGDLSSQNDVRRVASEFLQRFDRLDVLVNNAGAFFSERKESADGIEMTWALNHLGYFLLTNLLLDRIKATGSARVVSVASDAHRFASGINFDDPEGKKKYGGWAAYSQSKLANILFTRELARRLAGSVVTANCLHPGFVASNFTAGNGRMGWVLRQLASLFAINVDEGAKTSIYLASSRDVAATTGAYFAKCRQAKPTRAASNDASASRLWELSERMIAGS